MSNQAHVFDIGKHCSLAACQALDFTPHDCPHCARTFCSAHSTPSSHACPANPALAQARDPSRYTGDASIERLLPPDDATRRQMERAERERTATAEQDKRAAARALIEKNFGRKMPQSAAALSPPASASTSTSTSTSAKGKSGKDVVRLMKLKSQAKPLDSSRSKEIPTADRLYISVHHAGANAADAERVYWLNKNITVGKLIDLLASAFGASNMNNDANLSPDKLLRVRKAGEKELLGTSATCAQAIENGESLLFGQAGDLT